MDSDKTKRLAGHATRIREMKKLKKYFRPKIEGQRNKAD
jgi:hypothetical protein